jgi:flagellin-like protein
MKGISAIISIVLILMITIALAALAYVSFSKVFTQTTGTSGQAVNNTLTKAQAQIKIETIVNGTTDSVVYVRNIGGTDLTGFSAYVNDAYVGVEAGTPAGGKISPGEVKNVNISSLIYPGNSVKITTAQSVSAVYTIKGSTGTYVAPPPSCQPNCGSRVCGPDPVCGVSCGTCPVGNCDSNGQCQPPSGSGWWNNGFLYCSHGLRLF